MDRYKKGKIVFWLFLAPALFSFLMVVIVPFLLGLYYSMTDWTAIAEQSVHWVELKNYKDMFSNIAYRYSFFRTFLFTLISVVTVNVVSLTLAILVTRNSKGSSVFRAGFFVPNLIGGLVLGYI